MDENLYNMRPGSETFMDKLLNYVKCFCNCSLSTLNQFGQFLNIHQYDTDSILKDINDDIYCCIYRKCLTHTSNIGQELRKLDQSIYNEIV
eukprot:20378_1